MVHFACGIPIHSPYELGYLIELLGLPYILGILLTICRVSLVGHAVQWFPCQEALYQAVQQSMDVAWFSAADAVGSENPSPVHFTARGTWLRRLVPILDWSSSARRKLSLIDVSIGS